MTLLGSPQSQPSRTEIFVFGSNMQGRHGKGAALFARQKWGAIYGQAVGLQGQSYAIPTKETPRKSMTLEQIEPYIKEFLEVATVRQDLLFLLTPIGCGLAGNKKHEMLSLLTKYKIPSNVVLTKEWIQDDISNL